MSERVSESAGVGRANGAREAEGPPFVSVIIPAYDCAAFIAETLDSVFAQTFGGHEVIVVNDGSPDTEELERVLAPYLARIVYVRQENRGAGAARNRGLREARGEFVAFLDGDDLWLPRFLEAQLSFIRGGGYDFAYADALLFGDSTQAGKTFMQTAPSDGPVTFRSLIRGECNVITSGVVARRRPVLDAGAFDEALRNAQDFDLWIRLALGGARMAYQRQVLLRYRCRAGSLSGDAVNRVMRELRVYSKIRDAYELSAAQRAEVEAAIRRMEGELHLVEGKAQLERGEFERARESFRRADELLPGWRLKAARVLLRVSPRLLLRLARRRFKLKSE